MGGRACNELHGLFVFLVFFCTFSSYVDYTFLSSLIRKKKKVEIKRGSERSNQKKKKEEEKHTHGRENNITGFKEEEEENKKKKRAPTHQRKQSGAQISHNLFIACSQSKSKEQKTTSTLRPVIYAYLSQTQTHTSKSQHAITLSEMKERTD